MTRVYNLNILNLLPLQIGIFLFQELNDAWILLKQLALKRQEKLFGAHEIQRFNRDADETVAWISEKDAVLSSDDYGRDLASVQTLQVYIYIYSGKPHSVFRSVSPFRPGYMCIYAQSFDCYICAFSLIA